MDLRTVILQRSQAEFEYLRHILSSEKDFRVLPEPTEATGFGEMVRRVRPDVLFLDVQVPGHDGLKLAEELQGLPLPAVVFTATDDRLARRAFELAAADYILKPFEFQSLRVALERVRHRLSREWSIASNGEFRGLVGSLRNGRGYKRHLLLRTIGRADVVGTDTIDRLESEGNYVRVHTSQDEFRVRSTLSSMAADLDPRQFVRVHRCTIVNVDRIDWIEFPASGDHVLHLEDGTMIDVARGRREHLYKIFTRRT